MSQRGEQAAGVGAAGCSLRPAAETDPAGQAAGEGGRRHAGPGGEEVPGPHRSHPPDNHLSLPRAAGHARESKSSGLFRIFHVSMANGHQSSDVTFPPTRRRRASWR